MRLLTKSVRALAVSHKPVTRSKGTWQMRTKHSSSSSSSASAREGISEAMAVPAKSFSARRRLSEPLATARQLVEAVAPSRVFPCGVFRHWVSPFFLDRCRYLFLRDARLSILGPLPPCRRFRCPHMSNRLRRRASQSHHWLPPSPFHKEVRRRQFSTTSLQQATSNRQRSSAKDARRSIWMWLTEFCFRHVCASVQYLGEPARTGDLQ